MKRVLVLASVASMIEQFNIPNIELLIEMNYEVEVACNFIEGNTCSDEKIIELKERLDSFGVIYHQIDFARNVSKVKQNIRAYRQVNDLLKKKKFEFIHCHSPIGGVIARLAARKMETKVIYTAHGFHFYKGAPLKNWLLFYPIEKLCSKWTDVLITINQEDYKFAKKYMKAKRVCYIPGIGIDTHVVRNLQDKSKVREALGVPQDGILLFSVGELNENKNHETVIKALKGTKLYYCIAGQGKKKDELYALIQEEGMADQIKLLGFRNDIKELLQVVDIFIFPSFREGLSVSLMEAMSYGLPCIASKIRGNTDLIDSKGGILFNPNNIRDCKNAISKMESSDWNQYSNYNVKKIEKFSKEVVLEKTKAIYKSI